MTKDKSYFKNNIIKIKKMLLTKSFLYEKNYSLVDKNLQTTLKKLQEF